MKNLTTFTPEDFDPEQYREIYQRVWSRKYGKIPVDVSGRSCPIHHINHNHFDNRLENLICITSAQHTIHHKLGVKVPQTSGDNNFTAQEGYVNKTTGDNHYTAQEGYKPSQKVLDGHVNQAIAISGDNHYTAQEGYKPSQKMLDGKVRQRIAASGRGNGGADPELYWFKNIKTGQFRFCDRIHMKEEFGVNLNMLFKTKPYKTSYGWTLLSKTITGELK